VAPGLRESRRLQRIQTSRDQILDIAEEMFGQRGYAKASLKEIAERSEFSVGAIYTFFQSKSDLLHAVFRRRTEAELASMERLVASQLPPAELLVSLAELEVEYFRTYRNWGRMMMGFLLPFGAAVPDGDSLGDWFRSGYRRAIDIQAGVIAAGQAQRTIRPGDPQSLSRLFTAMAICFHQMDAEIGQQPRNFDLDEFLEFIRSTFLVRPDAPA
jgi:AcrR family transcriptional regulator